jgi:hypothetical protein
MDMMESIMFKATFVVIGFFLVLIIEKIFRSQSKRNSHN